MSGGSTEQVKIHFVTSSGKKRYLSVDIDEKLLALNDQNIESVDLSPIDALGELVHIRLDRNVIKRIDLSPLQGHSSLGALWLGSNRLSEIDLSPLRTCSHFNSLGLSSNSLEAAYLEPLHACPLLRFVALSNNRIRRINLNPLEESRELRELALSDNRLGSINLDGLGNCTEMEYLKIDGNEIESLDLSPISRCAKLKELHLQGNRLQQIDLVPLRKIEGLQSIDLTNNPLKKVDVTPIYLKTERRALKGILKRVLVKSDVKPTVWVSQFAFEAKAGSSRPALTKDWEFLHAVALEFGQYRSIQQNILWALGLGYFGFVDCDLSQIILSCPPDISYEEARTTIETAVARLVPEQIKESGLTTGMDLEAADDHPEIAILTNEILKLRAAEMKKVRIFTGTSPWFQAYLKPLWLTHYGYMILTSLGVGTEANEEELDKIRKLLSGLGFDIQIYELEGEEKKRRTMPVKMSKPLKEFIWWLAGHRAHELP